MKTTGNNSIATIRLQNARNSMADVEQLLIRAQDVVDMDLTGLIATAQELKANIVRALAKVPGRQP